MVWRVYHSVASIKTKELIYIYIFFLMLNMMEYPKCLDHFLGKLFNNYSAIFFPHLCHVHVVLPCPGCLQRWWEPSVVSCNSSPMPRWMLWAKTTGKRSPLMGFGQFYWIFWDFKGILWDLFIGCYGITMKNWIAKLTYPGVNVEKDVEKLCGNGKWSPNGGFSTSMWTFTGG